MSNAVRTIDSKRKRLTCAFCKHWYDPTSSHIRPVNSFMVTWEFDYEVKSPCRLLHRETKSQATCDKFERKDF